MFFSFFLFIYFLIVGDPDKYRKQADVVQTAAKNLEDEATRLMQTHEELERVLNQQAKKKKVTKKKEQKKRRGYYFRIYSIG